ncbi:hypothetical protein J6590_075610 [Homalodisca vitripennis]|nr:hypothetical protein J6590_075610 [Homalodisca vitripennis]
MINLFLGLRNYCYAPGYGFRRKINKSERAIQLSGEIETATLNHLEKKPVNTWSDLSPALLITLRRLTHYATYYASHIVRHISTTAITTAYRLIATP